MKKPFTLERYMVVRDLRFSLLVLLLSRLPLSGGKKMEMAPFDLMRERGRGWQPEPNHDASSLRTGIKFDGDGGSGKGVSFLPGVYGAREE